MKPFKIQRIPRFPRDSSIILHFSFYEIFEIIFLILILFYLIVLGASSTQEQAVTRFDTATLHVTRISSTIPSIGAVIVVSIFIASVTINGSPLATD